jgi:hypothetical protein
MRRRRAWIAAAAPLLLAAAAATPSTPPTKASPTSAAAAAAFAAPIEAAQGLAAWRAQQALQTDIVVRWGDRVGLDARMTFTTDLGRSRLRLADGTIAVFDGQHAWVSPASSGFERARFHLRTWPYFLAAPMKLRDPGTHLEPLGDRPLRPGTTAPAARLTFAPGTGDTPDDWYVVYRDPASSLLAGLAYIVTYGRSAGEAAKEPHAVLFSDFKAVAGVQIPTRWTFYPWSERQGAGGEPIGEVQLSGLRFLTPAPDAFVRPADSREDALPATPE